MNETSIWKEYTLCGKGGKTQDDLFASIALYYKNKIADKSFFMCENDTIAIDLVKLLFRKEKLNISSLIENYMKNNAKTLLVTCTCLQQVINSSYKMFCSACYVILRITLFQILYFPSLRRILLSKIASYFSISCVIHVRVDNRR